MSTQRVYEGTGLASGEAARLVSERNGAAARRQAVVLVPATGAVIYLNGKAGAGVSPGRVEL